MNRSANSLPEYATEFSAGMDVRADNAEPVTIPPLGRALVPTGLYLEIPSGYEVQVRPRSGLAARKGVTVLNAPGTIDSDYRGEVCVILVNLGSEPFVVESDYRGEVCVILVNLGSEPFVVERGERIAQLVLARHEKIEWEAADSLEESVRGGGGFGSTGTK